jgi:hypothetical protein
MRATVLTIFAASSLLGTPSFRVRLAPGLRTAPVDGRIIVVISRNLQGEPRAQVTEAT